jgi:hypothetical protein
VKDYRVDAAMDQAAIIADVLVSAAGRSQQHWSGWPTARTSQIT